MKVLTHLRPRLLGVATLLCFGSLLFAETATMKFTGVNGNSYGGVFVNPYTADINGVSTVVICNDFTSETHFQEEWYANVHHLSDSEATLQSGTKWGSQTGFLTNYYAVAYLSVLLLAETNTQQATALSFAIWSIFAQADVNDFLNGDPILDAVNIKRAEALAAVSNSGGAPIAPNFDPANVTIYSYASLISCPGGCAPPPQEFIVVKTPEPAAIGLMMFDLLALAAFCLVVVRGRRSQLSGLLSRS